MKTTHYIPKRLVLLFLIPIIFVSCKKDNTASKVPDPIPVVTTTDVYAAGYERNANGFQIAKVWKNGVAITLSTDGNDTYASSVFVSGNDVYVAGAQFIGGNTTGNAFPIAKLWKNAVDIPVSNTTDTIYGSASTVSVSGSDVYVAVEVDSEFNATTSLIRVYKNGVGTTLSSPLAGLYSMFISGSDVYVSGDEFNASALAYESKIWKNGVATVIEPNQSGNDYAGNVFVSGNDVYEVGRKISTLPNAYATFWKNGIANNLTDGLDNAWATAIYVSGTDVYIAGNEGSASGGMYIPKIWKNGVATSLTDGTHNASAYSIFVSGTDVYAAGSEFISTGQAATIWKNGVATHLTNSVQADVASLFVTNQ